MDTSILLAGAGFLTLSLALLLGIERIVRRFGAEPADPGQRSRGIVDVARKMRQWSSRRARERDETRSGRR